MATPSGCALFYPLSKKKYRYAHFKGAGIAAAFISIVLAGLAAIGIFELYTRLGLF